MNILQKQKLLNLIEEYGEDCSYFTERKINGTYGEELKAGDYKFETLQKIISLIEEL